MATGKRISEQSIAESLQGDELFPFAKNGSNGVAEAQTIKEYVNDGLDTKYATIERVNDQLDGFAPKSWLASTDQEVSRINDALIGGLNDKVDKVEGKGLSANDFTDVYREKLDSLPTDTALSTMLDSKVDAEAGRGLSEEDYTTAEKSKLAALPTDDVLQAALNEKADKSTTYTKTETDNHIDSLGVRLSDTWEAQLDTAYNSLNSNKVDKVEGKQLSTEDYTTADKDKLTALPTGAEFTEALDGKVDKVTGKQLSTEDFTTALKTKLDGLSNYNDTALTASVNTLKGRLDTLVGSDDVSSVIDTFNEIEAFLQGITNTQTLTGLLQEMKSEIVADAAGKYVTKNGYDLISGIKSFRSQLRFPKDNNDTEGIYISTYTQGTGIAFCRYENSEWAANVALLNENGDFKATSFVKVGGTSSQFLKADGSVDSTSYLPTASYTASDILDKVKSVDGSGSGLDADLLDGLEATAFCRADQTAAVDLNTVNNSGIMTCSLSSSATPERHYPIQEAGTMFYGLSAYYRANQLYGTFGTNRWFARGAGSTEHTAWREFAFLDSNVASADKVLARKLTNENINNHNVSGALYYGDESNTCLSKPTEGAFSMQSFYIGNNSFCQVYINKDGDILKRVWNGTSWTAWIKIASVNSNVASADKLTTKQLTNEDLNTIKVGGTFYYASGDNSVINKPSNIDAFSLQVLLTSANNILHILTESYTGNIYKRCLIGTSWSSWQQLATTDGAVAKLTTKQLTNEDLNTIKDANFSSYWAGGNNTCTNKATGAADSFGLIVMRIATGYYRQIFCYGTYTYIRDYNASNSSWTPWKKMLTEDDVTKVVEVTELPASPSANTLYCIPE